MPKRFTLSRDEVDFIIRETLRFYLGLGCPKVSGQVYGPADPELALEMQKRLNNGVSPPTENRL